MFLSRCDGTDLYLVYFKQMSQILIEIDSHKSTVYSYATLLYFDLV